MKKFIVTLGALLSVIIVSASQPKLASLEQKPLIKNLKSITLQDRPQTRATLDDDNWFGYCLDIYDGFGPGAGYDMLMEAVIEIPEEIAQEWVGLQVDAVNIGFGKAPNKDVNIFVTKSLDIEPAVMQEATMTEEKGWNVVNLNEPYTIDGDGFYVGYQCVIDSRAEEASYPICLDGFYTELPYGDILGIFEPNQLTGQMTGGYYNYGQMYGNVCLKIHLSNESPMAYGVMLNTIFQDDTMVAQGSEFGVNVSIMNVGAKTINSAQVTVTMNGETQDAQVEVIQNPMVDEEGNDQIPFGSPGYLLIDGIKAKGSGTQEFKVDITSFGYTDGTTSESNLSFTSEILVVGSTYSRNVVVEEYTGTWCGWCPRGMVGMAYMEENYDDDGFIGIAVHWYPQGASKDDMTCATYSELAEYMYYSYGYPCAMMDRTYEFDPSSQTLEQYFEECKAQPAALEVTLEAEYDIEKNALTGNAVTTYGFSSDKPNVALAFVLTEDKVGPYSQTNYFAGGSNGQMGGWEDKAASVGTLYNHVARLITGTGGLEDSQPGKVTEGQSIPYSITLDLDKFNLDLPSVTGAMVPPNINNCHLIVMALNTVTGEVMNAAKVDLKGMAGVESILAEPSDGVYRVYNPQGLKVLETRDASQIDALPRGIYIINGKKAFIQ